MIFAYRDYKIWLKSILELHEERGFRAKLAEAAGCQRAFLSQVINGNANLTADHAAGIAEYMALDERETEFLQLLILYSRAATKKLRSYLDKRLNKLAKEYKHLGERLKRPAPQDNMALEYYSDWIYSAIHMLLTIPQFRSEWAIAERLHLQASVVQHHLRRLEDWGLARKGQDNLWEASEDSLHIPSEHPMTAVHHRNWRLKACEHNPKFDALDNFRFTAVCSLSVEDLQELQRRMTEFVLQTQKLVSASHEEEVACICLDIFSP